MLCEQAPFWDVAGITTVRAEMVHVGSGEHFEDDLDRLCSRDTVLSCCVPNSGPGDGIGKQL